jgi:hypothetical protein
MTTTYEGALNEVFSAFNSGISANSVAILGYVPYIEWPGSNTTTPPDASKFWLRISSKGADSGQGTLSENVVTNGSRRFETVGLIFVQIMAPKRDDALAMCIRLGMTIQNIFRNRTLNVILRNAKLKEMPYENGCLRMNVTAEFEFDEIL